MLLNVALCGTASRLERLVRQFRRVQEVEELSREARQREKRAVRYHYDEDGSLVLEARLPAEAGALLLKALDAAVPEAPRDPADSQDSLHVYAETSPVLRPRPTSLSARRADAPGVLAASFLAHGAAALNGGERHQIAVHVEEATLKERHAALRTGRGACHHGRDRTTHGL